MVTVWLGIEVTSLLFCLDSYQLLVRSHTDVSENLIEIELKGLRWNDININHLFTRFTCSFFLKMIVAMFLAQCARWLVEGQLAVLPRHGEEGELGQRLDRGGGEPHPQRQPHPARHARGQGQRPAQGPGPGGRQLQHLVMTSLSPLSPSLAS